MEVFLCERKLGREAIGDDDLQCLRVVCYALLRFTGVRSEALQHCFDPLYLFIGQYHHALSFQFTTAIYVELLHVRNA